MALLDINADHLYSLAESFVWPFKLHSMHTLYYLLFSFRRRKRRSKKKKTRNNLFCVHFISRQSGAAKKKDRRDDEEEDSVSGIFTKFYFRIFLFSLHTTMGDYQSIRPLMANENEKMKRISFFSHRPEYYSFTLRSIWFWRKFGN